jgi:hypothetical protein
MFLAFEIGFLDLDLEIIVRVLDVDLSLTLIYNRLI